MKDIVWSTLMGVLIALVIFCAIGVGFDLYQGGRFQLAGYGFTKMVLASVAVGIGFGAPAAIYRRESVPGPMRVVFHMGIGCAVYIAAGFFAGWIPTSLGPLKCALIICGQLGFSFLIWLGFLLYFRGEARRLNELLRRREP